MLKFRFMIAAAALAVPATAIATGAMVVHRDPGCGCCANWAKRLEKAFGRSVRMIDDERRDALKKRAGVPGDLSSCHTALIGGYVFEGHVPFADIKRFLAAPPKGMKGLAVAGMPVGAPGMEAAGVRADPFEVVAFGPAGRRLFARHPG